MEEREKVGTVDKFFGKVMVAALVLEGHLRTGDKIQIKGHTTDFEQSIESMQIEHEDVSEAGPGDMIGVKVKERVRPNDVVYKITLS